MRGSVFKRCTCPVRVDERGRKLTCGKQHGSWSFKVDVPTGDGSRRQLVRGGFGTRKEAEEAMADAITKANRGIVFPSSRLKLGPYLDQWLIAKQASVETAAYGNYKRCVELYVKPWLGGMELAMLTGAALTAHYARLLAEGGRNGRALSPTTVRTVHRVLSNALGDAVRDDVLPSNPALKAMQPKRRRFEATVWSAEQATTFLLHVRHDRLYACWLIALSCGLRRGELAGLRWTEVDLDHALLRVTTQRTTDSSYNVILKGPKGTGRRTIDLGVGTVAALRAHRDAQLVRTAQQEGALFPLELVPPLAAERPESVDERPESVDVRPDSLRTRPSALPEYVFLDDDGEPIHPQRLTDLFQAAAKAAGVPVIRLHDARHSCATLALESGAHPKVVQQLLGHSSWSTTMDLYGHRVDRLQREATQNIEDLILRPDEEDGSDGPGVAEAG